ncbi:DUF4180 domain-containing protein [Pedobacter deserti]|uniref:DUF4180 domain-containing protein n=1 Tax=Pedobacter deserti TaxID=2817382 RepID=UPI00210D7113|nr:DUF4180 domain-containing protein [Pedobacter sp. SYSU D00382]
MQIIAHNTDNINTAELVSSDILINNPEDTLQLIVDLYYQDYDRIVVSEKNIAPEFFDLKTGLAGEILQKFVNYKMRLVIVGDFEKYTSQSMKDFIFESNKGIQINFVKSFDL